MRRTTPTQPVTPAMLRHFAVLTVVITSCLAIFAQGENNSLEEARRAVASKNGSAGAFSVNGAAKQAQERKALREIGGLKIAADTKIGGGFRADAVIEREAASSDGGGSGSGSGSGDTGNNTDANSSPAAVAGQPMMPPPGSNPVQLSPGPPGMPPGVGPNQRRGPPTAQPPRKPTAQEIDRMIAAARERSGSATQD